MRYLTTLQVIAIHDQLMIRFGGSGGIRSLDPLESAVGRLKVTFERKDLYSTLFAKAAALFHSLLKNHSFVDGNKRTAYTCASLFLEINGYRLKNLREDAVEFCVLIETKNLNVQEISDWLKKNSKKIA